MDLHAIHHIVLTAFSLIACAALWVILLQIRELRAVLRAHIESTARVHESHAKWLDAFRGVLR